MEKYGVRVCPTCGGQTVAQDALREMSADELSALMKTASDGHACSCSCAVSDSTSPAASGADQKPDNGS